MILILSFIDLNVRKRTDLYPTYPLASAHAVLNLDILAGWVDLPAFFCHLFRLLSLVLDRV